MKNSLRILLILMAAIYLPITSGNVVAQTSTNLDWNSILQPGQSATFGLQGNHDGSFVVPTCSATQAD